MPQGTKEQQADRSSRASTLCYSKKERRKATGLEEPFLAALGSLRFGAHAFQTHLALHARLGSPNEPAQSECCHLTCARRAFCLSKQNHGYTISITYQAFRFLASHPCGAQPPIQKRTHSILGSGHKNPVPDISWAAGVLLAIQGFKVFGYPQKLLWVSPHCNFPKEVDLFFLLSLRAVSTLSHSNPWHSYSFIPKNDYRISHLTNFTFLTISRTSVRNHCHLGNIKGCLV